MLVHDAVHRLLDQLSVSEALCADAMAVLCCDRAAEIATLSVPIAAALARSAAAAAARAVSIGEPSKRADVLATLRHLLACPSLRDVAIKASRLKSLAIAAMETAWQCGDLTRADSASAALLQVLREAGVDIITAGSLEESTTPLNVALRRSLRGAAQVLLDAGADVNGLPKDGLMLPLCSAVCGSSDSDMSLLLERGASLTLTNSYGRTIAHALAAIEASHPASNNAAFAEFCSRCVRRVIAAEPSLLEAREANGHTPPMAAVRADSTAGITALLELGADVGATNATGDTALSLACSVDSLPTVRQLIAAGAAGVAALPPGSRQAKKVAFLAVRAARVAGHGCGECAARCGGRAAGNCADGLDILRAVLAAGVRDAVSVGGVPLALEPVACIRRGEEAERISEGHALTVLQALRTAGVDVLVRGTVNALPILHAAADANAPELVRWLVAEAGAPLEERVSPGDTPLLLAFASKAWAAAHALIDCGARVDVEGGQGQSWPVLTATHEPDIDAALLRRILAADRDSLLRCTPAGITAVHIAATYNAAALPLLLDRGLPHLAEAVNAVATLESPVGTDGMKMTPLHVACRNKSWVVALALLAAGARVDIAGNLDGRRQTVAEWARRSPACKHRGVKLAIAARAREHAAQAAASAKGLSSRGSGSILGAAVTAACAPAAAAGDDSSRTADGAAADDVAGASTAGPADGGLCGNGKQPKGRKGGRGAASNRPEELPSAVDEARCTAIAGTAGPVAVVIDGGAGAPASVAGPAGTASGALGSCKDLSAAAAVSSGAGTACIVASAAGVSSPSSVNLSEDPVSQPPLAMGAAPGVLGSPVHHCVAANCTDGPGSVCVPQGPADRAPAAGSISCAPSTNTCEPGTAAEICDGICTPGASTVPNTCELGEAATPPRAEATAAHSSTGESGPAADSAGATLIAALQDDIASAATVRRHLAALSELARDPAAAAALERQGAVTAIGFAVSRHGAAVALAAGALLMVLGAAAADSEGEEEESEA